MASWRLRLLAPALLASVIAPAAAFAAGGSGSVAVTTNAVSSLTSTSVRFNGQVAASNANAEYRFNYGVDDGSAPGHYTQKRTVSASGSAATVAPTETISDLTPNTSYVVALQAKPTSGSDTNLRSGATVRFTTPRSSSGSGSSGSGSGSGSSGSGSGSSGSGSSGSGSSGSSGSGKSTTPAKTSPTTTAGDTPASSDSPAPQAGQSVGVAPSGGTVLVRRPGTGDYDRLAAGATVPMGSIVDTRSGQVALTSKLPSGKTQTGYFRGGLFLVRQSRDGTVDLHLRGPVCTRAPRAKRSLVHAVFAAASKRRGGNRRRLFGRDKGGKFRTHGKQSQATVRGTRWLVEDRCDGTLTTVSEGAVEVRERRSKRRVLVRAGQRHLARARR